MSIVHLLHRSNQRASDTFNARKTSLLTISQQIVLSAIAANPKASQSDLTVITNVDRSTMADVVRRMIRSGYVTRIDNPDDARAYSLTLTAKGQAEVKKATADIEKAEKELLQSLPAGLRGSLVDALTRITAPKEAAE